MYSVSDDRKLSLSCWGYFDRVDIKFRLYSDTFSSFLNYVVRYFKIKLQIKIQKSIWTPSYKTVRTIFERFPLTDNPFQFWSSTIHYTIYHGTRCTFQWIILRIELTTSLWVFGTLDRGQTVIGRHTGTQIPKIERREVSLLYHTLIWT